MVAASTRPRTSSFAELAAAGRLNREIAETLVVSLATVEYHLRHAYRKLGIRSRAKLNEALAAKPRAKVRLVMLERGWTSRSSAATSKA